jgi:hypothetical protein
MPRPWSREEDNLTTDLHEGVPLFLRQHSWYDTLVGVLHLQILTEDDVAITNLNSNFPYVLLLFDDNQSTQPLADVSHVLILQCQAVCWKGYLPVIHNEL